MKPREKMYWMDRDIETLSREELIEALYSCYQLYRSSAEDHKATLNMWERCRKAAA